MTTTTTTSTTATPTASGTSPGAVRRPAILLSVLLLATFMTTLDTTIVNVAAPVMQTELGLSAGSLELVLAGYATALAALLVFAARLGDDVGHRRLLLVGIAGFTASSLACGLAPDAAVLIAARLIQGASAAALMPQVTTILQLRWSGAAQQRAFAMQAAVIALGAAAGQVLGGLLVSANIDGLGWRPVFLVNVPVGLVLLAVLPQLLTASRAAKHRRPDALGAAVLTALLLLIVVPLSFGHTAGWAPWTWICLLAALPTAALLRGHLLHAEATGGDPLIPPTLLRSGPLLAGLLAIGASMVAYGGFLLLFTLHLQDGLHFTPLRSGLTFLPYALGFAVASMGAPALAGGSRLLPPLALSVAAAAYGLLAWSVAGGEWHPLANVTLLLVAGAGFGAAFTPLFLGVVGRTPATLAHAASGLTTTTVQLGFAIGIAAVGAVYVALVAHHTGGLPAAAGTAVCAGLALTAAACALLLPNAARSGGG